MMNPISRRTLFSLIGASGLAATSIPNAQASPQEHLTLATPQTQEGESKDIILDLSYHKYPTVPNFTVLDEQGIAYGNIIRVTMTIDGDHYFASIYITDRGTGNRLQPTDRRLWIRFGGGQKFYARVIPLKDELYKPFTLPPVIESDPGVIIMRHRLQSSHFGPTRTVETWTKDSYHEERHPVANAGRFE